MATRIGLFAMFILFLVSCTREPEKDCDYNRKFTIPVTIEPFSSHYNVGDTINLRIEIPQDMYDSTKGEYVDVREWQYSTYLVLQELKQGELLQAEHHFSYSSEFYIAEIDSFWVIICAFDNNEEIRILDGNISFNKPGTYLFSFFNYNRELTLDDCPNRRLLLHYQLNDDLGKNYELIEEESLKEKIVYDELIEYGGYIFVVEP